MGSFFQDFLTNLMKVSFVIREKFKKKGGEYIHVVLNGRFYMWKGEHVKKEKDVM